MQKEAYLQYVTSVVESDLQEKEKEGYLRILSVLLEHDTDELNNFETNSYKRGEKSLTEQEKVNFELNLLRRTLAKSVEGIDIEIKKIAYPLSKKTEIHTIQKAKQAIIRLQIKYGLSPKFYTEFESLIKDTFDITGKKEKTVQKVIKSNN